MGMQAGRPSHFELRPALALIVALHYCLSYRLKLNKRHSQCGRSEPGNADFGFYLFNLVTLGNLDHFRHYLLSSVSCL
jgi:hypothetical protein